MKVLISDDDPTTRLLMSTLIRKKLGYEVFETTDGLKAWQALDSGMEAQLCVLDMWMPGMRGLDLLSKLRSDPRFARQKVILCSSENGKDVILQAAALGVSGYLLKPFATEHFLEQVRKACEGGPASPGTKALEPVEAALERLGIEKKIYLDLLNVLAKDVARVVADLGTPPAKEKKRNWEIRLSGLRGAGRCVGADPLVEAIKRLEKIDITGDPAALKSCLESLQTENNRLAAAIAVVAAYVGPSEKKPQDPKPQEEKPKPAPAPAAKVPKPLPA